MSHIQVLMNIILYIYFAFFCLLQIRDAKNILEAASQGASASISLVANIAVNLMAFLSLLAFFNSVLSWLGNMFDYPQLSFEVNIKFHQSIY